MTPDASSQQLRDSYLARLDTALRDLPYGVAADIRAGVAEGFEGLDAAALQERIRQLGDPAIIAREAAAETMDAASGRPSAPLASSVMRATADPAPIVKTPLGESKGFAIIAALVLGFGGFIVPIGGWIAGVVMVVTSRLWHGWEKLVGIVTPAATVALTAAISAIISLGAPGPSDVSNPLLPAILDLIWSSILLVPLCGAWLLWRLKGRSGPVERR